MHKLGKTLPIIVPAILLVVATIVFRITDLDTYVCGLFFGGGGQWPMADAQPFKFIYQYGTYPAWGLGYVSLAIWLVTLLFHHGIARRAFFCAMVVVLGPGLLINGILKPHMSRPRPCQIARFGGQEKFLPVLNFGPMETDVPCRSFPSGHASMGFALLAPTLLLRRRRGWYALSLGLAISSGLAVGITRIVQGRHFPSDVLWSAAIVYFTTVGLYYAVGLHREAALTEGIGHIDRDGRLISMPLWPRQSRQPQLTVPEPSRAVA